MSQESELKRLESFVSKLLQSFQELKEENGRLIQELQARDENIVSLREQLAASDMERNEINNRVSGIIEQIEEWEINLGEEVFDDIPVDEASRQSSLFNSVEAESAEDVKEESNQESNRANEY